MMAIGQPGHDQPGDSKPAYEWATIPAPALLPKTIQLGTHQISKLLFAQKESAPTASSPISIIIFQDQSQWGNFWVICNIC